MSGTALLEERAPAHAVVRRLIANGIALLFAWLLPRFATAISVIVAARVLGAARFGVWGTAAAYAVILSIAATLGMQPLLVREMVRAPERTGALLGAADRVKAGALVVMLLLVYGLSRPMGHSGEVTAEEGAELLHLRQALPAESLDPSSKEVRHASRGGVGPEAIEFLAQEVGLEESSVTAKRSCSSRRLSRARFFQRRSRSQRLPRPYSRMMAPVRKNSLRRTSSIARDACWRT